MSQLDPSAATPSHFASFGQIELITVGTLSKFLRINLQPDEQSQWWRCNQGSEGCSDLVTQMDVETFCSFPRWLWSFTESQRHV